MSGCDSGPELFSSWSVEFLPQRDFGSRIGKYTKNENKYTGVQYPRRLCLARTKVLLFVLATLLVFFI